MGPNSSLLDDYGDVRLQHIDAAVKNARQNSVPSLRISPSPHGLKFSKALLKDHSVLVRLYHSRQPAFRPE